MGSLKNAASKDEFSHFFKNAPIFQKLVSVKYGEQALIKLLSSSSYGCLWSALTSNLNIWEKWLEY